MNNIKQLSYREKTFLIATFFPELMPAMLRHTVQYSTAILENQAKFEKHWNPKIMAFPKFVDDSRDALIAILAAGIIDEHEPALITDLICTESNESWFIVTIVGFARSQPKKSGFRAAIKLLFHEELT